MTDGVNLQKHQTNVLEVKNLKKIYGPRTVVKDVSLSIKSGEVVGLLGPNGAGKTTTFYMIVGLVAPNGGQILLNGESIQHLPIYKRARIGITYLPQENSVFRTLTVEENIQAILEPQTNEDGSPFTKKQIKEELEKLLNELQITGIRKNLAPTVSGGERRRTEIARALAARPRFILLDEPFAGVDPIAVEDIQYIVYKLKEKNIGILITDHNAPETLSITDRAYLLFEGKILFQGTSEEPCRESRCTRKVSRSRIQLPSQEIRLRAGSNQSSLFGSFRKHVTTGTRVRRLLRQGLRQLSLCRQPNRRLPLNWHRHCSVPCSQATDL